MKTKRPVSISQNLEPIYTKLNTGKRLSNGDIFRLIFEQQSSVSQRLASMANDIQVIRSLIEQTHADHNG